MVCLHHYLRKDMLLHAVERPIIPSTKASFSDRLTPHTTVKSWSIRFTQSLVSSVSSTKAPLIPSEACLRKLYHSCMIQWICELRKSSLRPMTWPTFEHLQQTKQWMKNCLYKAGFLAPVWRPSSFSCSLSTKHSWSLPCTQREQSHAFLQPGHKVMHIWSEKMRVFAKPAVTAWILQILSFPSVSARMRQVDSDLEDKIWLHKNSKSDIRSEKSDFQDLKSWIRDSKSDFRNWKPKIRKPKSDFRSLNLRCRIDSWEHRL